MSHEYYYQTVQREQEFLQEELEVLRLEQERLEWELQATKNDLSKVLDYIHERLRMDDHLPLTLKVPM